jgi:hypothetical protein
MNLKHADLSLFAGDIELVTLPGEYLDTLNFPYVYEDFKEITIVFGDTGMKNDIMIEFKLFEQSKHVDFIVNGNNICYERLFNFIDESADEPITIAIFKDFQLIEALMFQKGFNGFARRIPKKPVIRCYKNGDLKYLKFMPIDNLYTYTNYSGVARWNKPYTLCFNENEQVKNSDSTVWFKDYKLNTDTEIMTITEYVEFLHRLTGHTVNWNPYTYEFEFDNYHFTALDETMFNIYVFFEHYEKNLGHLFQDICHIFKDKNALLKATAEEKALLHMLTL